MDDLSPLKAKSSGEVMLSHIQKLVQVCVVGHLRFFFFLFLFHFFFFLAFLLLREKFFVGVRGVPIHLWEALGFRKEGGHV